MINSELSFPLKDQTTVVTVDTSEQTAIVYDETKNKTKYYVAKSFDNSPFFSINSDYVVPTELSGQYSSVTKAVEACCTYLKNSKQSFSVKSDELAKARKERNAAKNSTKTSELV